MKIAEPLELDTKDEKVIEDKISQYLYYSIFMPLIEIAKVKKSKIINNADIDTLLQLLTEAIASGKLVYEIDRFKGVFNARISKALRSIGAKNIGKSFKIDFHALPQSIQNTVHVRNKLIQDMKGSVLSELNTLAKDDVLFKVLNFSKEYEDILRGIDMQFDDKIDIKRGVKDFFVNADLSKQQKRQIAENYSENLKLYIKSFRDEEILKLRQEVQERYFAGYRSESLAQILQERYQVSKKKAKFLANQETGLLFASYQEARAIKAGVKKFKWTRTGAKKPDPFHKQYYNQIFSFDDLPIIDERTGQRGLPRQRYGCSCGMRLVVE